VGRYISPQWWRVRELSVEIPPRRVGVSASLQPPGRAVSGQAPVLWVFAAASRGSAPGWPERGSRLAVSCGVELQASGLAFWRVSPRARWRAEASGAAGVLG